MFIEVDEAPTVDFFTSLLKKVRTCCSHPSAVDMPYLQGKHVGEVFKDVL